MFTNSPSAQRASLPSGTLREDTETATEEGDLPADLG